MLFCSDKIFKDKLDKRPLSPKPKDFPIDRAPSLTELIGFILKKTINIPH